MSTTLDINSALYHPAVDKLFDTVMVEPGSFISALQDWGTVENSRFTWYDRVLTPTVQEITSINGNGAGTTFNVADSSGFAVDDILQPRLTSTEVPTGEQIRVASIVSSTQITVERTMASTSSVTLTTGHEFKNLGKANAQGSGGVARNLITGSERFNYTMIVDDYIAMSRTLLNSATYTKDNELKTQLEDSLRSIKRKMNNFAINGLPVAYNGTVASQTAGVLSQLSGGLAVGSAGALTMAKINAGFKLIHDAGGTEGDYALVMNSENQKRLSAFNTSGSNPSVFVQNGDTRTGSRVTQVISELSGFSGTPLLDNAMPSDTIAIVNMRKAGKVFLNNSRMVQQNAGENYDGETSRLLTEFGIKIKDQTTNHCLITGITS